MEEIENMSPETQDLESFFKNIKRNDGLPGDFEPGKDGKQEFDSFFEKLSSLDDMNWDINADPTLDQEEKNSSTEIKQKNSVKSAEQKILRARKKHKMTIFHNKGEMNSVNQAEPESYDWRKELLGEDYKPE